MRKEREITPEVKRIRLQCRRGTSLGVPWLRHHTPDAAGLSLIPGQGTRSHVQQLKSLHAAMKVWNATTKTWSSQIIK